MHADVMRQHEGGHDDGLAGPVLMALALHGALVLLLVLAGWWNPLPEPVSVAARLRSSASAFSPA